MKYLVTGGAGFIGSHIVDHLIKNGNDVVVYDNFSTGRKLFIEHHLKNKKFKLIKGDLLDTKKLSSAMKGVYFVFHFAAHADVREGFLNHEIDHIQNLEATRNVLEAMVKNNVKKIAFASTSSVYGDAKIHPTPENYPFEPTSIYGASKAAAESYILAYASYYGWNAYIFRFASFIGERYTHGIVFDIMKKLKKGVKVLNLLSDGTPKKSSVYVQDGVKGILWAINKVKEEVNIFNICQEEVMNIDQIVDTILKAAKVSIKKKYKGGNRGWKGDNNFVNLSNKKLKALGWKPECSFKDGLRKTVAYLEQNPKVLG